MRAFVQTAVGRYKESAAEWKTAPFESGEISGEDPDDDDRA